MPEEEEGPGTSPVGALWSQRAEEEPVAVDDEAGHEVDVGYVHAEGATLGSFAVAGSAPEDGLDAVEWARIGAREARRHADWRAPCPSSSSGTAH